MSRTRKPHGATPDVAASKVPPPIETARSGARPSSLTPIPRRPILLKLAIAGVLFWSLALGAMALLTANPPAISRAQILRADAIVTARLDEARPDRLHVERVIFGGLSPDDVVTVHNLPERSELAAGGICVVPLTHFRRDYLVTTLEGQRASPLIYRATPETIGVVKQLLHEANRE